MTDLHPDHLLDQVATGRVDARLAAHLRTCAVCRFEVGVRRDAAEDLREQPDDGERIDLAAERALGRWSAAPSVVLSPPAGPHQRPFRWGFVAGAAVGVVFALVLGWLVSGGSGLIHASDPSAVSAPRPVDTPGHADGADTRTEDRPSTTTTRSADHHGRAPPADATPSATAPSDDEAEAERPRPTRGERTERSHRRTHRTPRSAPRRATLATGGPHEDDAAAGAGEQGETPDAGTQAPDASPHAPDAATLFTAATAARRDGRKADALQLFSDLRRRFPASREATTAAVLSGRLRLELGRPPEQALRDFDAYLAHGKGSLIPEALAGRATALERLGRSKDANRDWAELVRRFPKSALARRARTRLQEASP